MALRNFKVLTFDVVGTLIDFERGMLTYLRTVSSPAVAGRSDDDILETTLGALVDSRNCTVRWLGQSIEVARYAIEKVSG